MHAKFFGCLALVAAVAGEDFGDETLFELTHCIGIGDAGGVHLYDEIVQFAFHVGAVPSRLKFYSVAVTIVACCNVQLVISVLRMARLDPIGCVVLDACGPVAQLLFQVFRYEEGYSMSALKKIRRHF